MQIKKTSHPTHIELEGELPSADLLRHRADALKHLSEHVNLPGFRKGHIPDNILIERLGEMSILEEMAERALSEAYPKILEDHVPEEAIGRPEIKITKIAPNNPLGFHITQSIVPKFTLPDYTKIATKVLAKNESAGTTVSEADIDNVIEHLRQERTKISREQDGESTPPEIDDTFAKSIGNFATLADLRKKIEENLIEEKKISIESKRRTALVDALVEATNVPVPEILLTRESGRLLADTRARLESMGMPWPDYLEKLGKREEEIKAEQRPQAEKRVRTGLILNAICKKENLSVTEDAIAKEVQHIIEHYPGANAESAREYVEDVLMNERVFQFLETGRSSI